MSRHAGRALIAGSVLLAGVFGGATVVSAQEEAPSTLVMRAVNTTQRDESTIDFLYTGPAADVDSLTLTENGNAVEPSSVEAIPSGDPAKGIVFVVDISTPMDTSGTLLAARETITTWIDDAPDGTQFAVVAAGSKASVQQDLTASKGSAKDAVESLGPEDIPAGAIWGSIRVGAAALAFKPDLQPNIVVIAGSNDDVTPDQQAPAQGAVFSSGAAVFATAYTGDGMRAGGLKSLVGRAGGLYSAVEDASLVPPSVEAGRAAVTDQQYRITFSSLTAEQQATDEQAATDAAEGGEEPVAVVDDQAAEFELSVGSETAAGTVVLGGDAVGQANLTPTKLESGGGIGFLQGGLGLALAVLVTLAACILLAYGVTSIFVQDDTLSNALQPYSDMYGSTDDDDDGQNRTALMQRAVALTEQVAESQGYLGRVEASLERAALPLRAGEAIFFYAGGILLATLLGIVLTKSLLGALVVGGISAMLPIAVVNYKASARRKKFLSLLPDTLQLLSGTLRAGYSLMQGVEAVSTEVEDPMGVELRRVVTESRLGRPLEEALESTAERMDSPDFSWAVMAIRIQREVGGNLSELLLTVADTMVQRERLRRDVATLTAEGRLSAIILGLLPVGLGIVMYLLNPAYISKLWTTGLGLGLFIGAIFAMLIGFFWMKKIITIEI